MTAQVISWSGTICQGSFCLMASLTRGRCHSSAPAVQTLVTLSDEGCDLIRRKQCRKLKVKLARACATTCGIQVLDVAKGESHLISVRNPLMTMPFASAWLPLPLRPSCFKNPDPHREREARTPGQASARVPGIVPGHGGNCKPQNVGTPGKAPPLHENSTRFNRKAADDGP